MHWEVWDTDTANQLADFASEAEALQFVGELLAGGWQATDLSLHFEDERLDDDALPMAVGGPDLLRRAERADARRRSA